MVLGYSVALFLALGAAVGLSLYDPVPLRADNELVQARAVLLRPSEWVGRRCPLVQHVAIDGHLDQGAWIVILARSTCPGCQDVLPEYQDLAYQASSPKRPIRLAVIEANADEAHRRAHAISHGSQSSATPPIVGHLGASRRWHANLPCVMLLFDGVVEMAIEGAMRGSSATMAEFAPVSQIVSTRGTSSAAVGTVEPPALPPSREPVAQ
jgi:hypothetical protein